MYLAVDIGGTKTLLAVFDDDGTITQQHKFATPSEYPAFLVALHDNFAQLGISVSKAVAAVPGRLDRVAGTVSGYGTLPWPPASIRDDLQKALGDIPVRIENDAKLAGLSEGILLKDEFRKVLYITISTGISNAIIIDGVIDPDFLDSEGGQMLVPDDTGTLKQWEDVASGRAIVAKYGKRASELDDPIAWQEIAHNLAVGIIDLITVIQPEVIVFGGGVGAHFEKFEQPLQAQLKELANSLTPVPPLRVAQHPEEAVLYGCIELMKQNHG